MYRTLLPLLSALHRFLSHSRLLPLVHSCNAHTPLQNFLTLCWYKYLQPRRRSSTTLGCLEGEGRGQWTRTCVSHTECLCCVLHLCARTQHTHMLSRRRCAALVSCPVARHAIGRCPRIPITNNYGRPLPVKGQNTVSNREEQTSSLRSPIALSAPVDWPPNIFYKKINRETASFRVSFK